MADLPSRAPVGAECSAAGSSAAACRIGLGTVQLGMPYGVTNPAGQVSSDEARRILFLADARGIRVIDTASVYGSSEAVLGRFLPGGADWRIVTKTPGFGAHFDRASATRLVADAFAQSLKRLCVDKVYGLLVHDAGDLLGPCGTSIWAEMLRLKSDGRVGKIGASVYTGAQAEHLLRRFPLDLLQVPFNAIDQRLARQGVLNRLQSANVEVHARSAFLQGLLVAPPESISSRFGALKRAIVGFQSAVRSAGFSPLEGALATVLTQPGIDQVIIGVTRAEELDAILAASVRAAEVPAHIAESWALEDEQLLNPGNWHALEPDGG